MQLHMIIHRHQMSYCKRLHLHNILDWIYTRVCFFHCTRRYFALLFLDNSPDVSNKLTEILPKFDPVAAIKTVHHDPVGLN